jgi:hypothetical protein
VSLGCCGGWWSRDRALVIVNVLELLVNWMTSGHVAVVLGIMVVLTGTIGVCMGVVTRKSMVVEVPVGWLSHRSEYILLVIDKLKWVVKRLV